MQLTTEWQCTGMCKKKFKVGEWECAPGVLHEVEPRTFYVLDAPSLSEKDTRGLAYRNSRLRVLNCPPERTMKDETGQLVRIPGGEVMFSRGTVTLTDPEKIFWLEKHGYGEITKERWEQVYFSPSEKHELREIELRNREKEAARTIKEANELLARVKEQTGAPKARTA